MPSITISFTVTDAVGAVFTGSAVASQDVVTATATITPANAPAGTSRTFAITPSGGTAPYTYGTPSAPGLTFTPVSGQPGSWTFVY